MNTHSNVLEINDVRKKKALQPHTHRTQGALTAMNHIAQHFDDLVSKDVRDTWVDGETSKPQRISYGAYNEITYRAEDGTVLHGCAKIAGDLRNARPFTRNAVEMSCHALGLVIYIAGVTQIHPVTKRIQSAIRVATYHHRSLTPEISMAADPRVLYEILHGKLIATYNTLAQQYNLAGLDKNDLTLRSDMKRMPNICITDPL